MTEQERTVRVPVSLIKRAVQELFDAPGREALLACGELHALLSQSPLTAEPVQYNGHNGLAVFADAARRLNEGTPQGPAATPPRIEDMAPGTRYTAEVQSPPWSSLPTERRVLMRVDTLGRYPNHLSRDQFGSEIANDRIDPSTIRDVTSPKS